MKFGRIPRFAFALVLALLRLLEPSAQAQTNIYWDTAAGGGIGGSGSFSATGTNWATNPAGAANSSGGPTGDALFSITNAANGVSAVASGNYALNFGGTSGTVTNGGSFQMWGISVLTNGYVFTIDGTGANIRTLTMTNSFDIGANTVTFANGARGTNSFRFAGPAAGWAGGITAAAGASIIVANTNPSNLTNLGFYVHSGGSISSNAPITIQTLANTRVMLGSQDSGGGNFNSAIINNSAGGSPLELTNSSSGTVAFNGTISGSNGIVINNSAGGKIALTASNTYSGGTTVNGTGTGQINLSNSSALGTGVLTIAGAGTNYVRAAANNLNVANGVVINSGSTLRLGATNTGYRSLMSGVISGAGGIYYANSDNGLYLTGTNNSFSGGANNGSSGTLFIASLGMAGANSSIGTNGTITLSSDSGTSGAGTVQWLGTTNETSDKVFALSAISASTSQGVKIFAGDNNTNPVLPFGGANVTLTLNGNINSISTNNKVITLGAYSNNTLAVNGLINQTAGYTNSVVVGVTGQSGAVVLGNTNNSFGGGVTINAGASSSSILQVAQIGNAGANSALGTNGTINIGGASATGNNVLKYTGSGETSGKVINMAGTTGGATLDQSGTGNLKFTSTMTATGVGAKTLALQGSTVGTGEIASNINDLGGNTISLAKSGSGLWTLSGSNSYTGTTTIGAGTLRLGGVNALPSGGMLLGSSSTANASTLDLAAGGDYALGSFGSSTTAGGYMSFTNSSGSSATLTFTGPTNGVTLSSSTSLGRSVLNNSTNLTVTFNGAVDIGSSANNDMTFGGAGNIAINGAIFNTNIGVRALTKTGTGTLTLAGVNTYNGDTVVSGGSLVVASTGSIGSPAAAVSISNGATLRYNGSTALSASSVTLGGGAGRAVLGGSGTINSAVTLNSLTDVLSPGNSPGTLSLTANQAWSSFTYDWEINNFAGTTPGTDFDTISVAGTLDLSSGTPGSFGLNILSLTAGNVPGNVPGFTETGATWTILSASAITGFDAANWIIDSSSFYTQTPYAGSFSIAQLNNEILLNYTVPEPSTVALLVLGGTGLAAWRFARRRRP